MMSIKERVVLKVGSSNLCNGEIIDQNQIAALSALIYDLRAKYDVILVSSGAAASGYTQMQIDKSSIQNKQALASVGQPLLMESYRKAFATYDIVTAQLLLSGHDFDSRKRTGFAARTIDVLLANGVLPIINENDVIAITEFNFGDNDRLSAHVAHFFNAKLLVILSDIDGYFDKNPHEHKNAHIFPIIHSIPKEAMSQSHTPHGIFATGGIVTKLMAADFLLKRDKMMFLSHGRKLDVVRELLLNGNQTSGTLFCVKDSQKQILKH